MTADVAPTRLGLALAGSEVVTAAGAPLGGRWHAHAGSHGETSGALDGLRHDAEVTRAAGSVSVVTAQAIHDVAGPRREGPIRVYLDDEAGGEAGLAEA